MSKFRNKQGLWQKTAFPGVGALLTLVFLHASIYNKGNIKREFKSGATVGLHDILHVIVMCISSVKPVLWLVLNLHHMLSNPVDGAEVNTQSRSSLTSYAIRAHNHRWIAFDNERDVRSLSVNYGSVY